MIIVGTDVCGHKIYGEHRIISIILGKDDSLNALRNKIGVKWIHMSRISDYDKKEVVNKLDFRDNGLFALSLEVEKVRTVKYIHEHNKRKEKYFDIRLVYQHFDMLLLDKIKPILDNFSYRFNGAFRTLSVESDNDMDDTLRAWGMKHNNEGKAYELADAVAWCHNKDIQIDGCHILNLVDELRAKMEQDLLI